MQNNGGADIPGAHGGLELAEVIRQGHVAKFIHHQSYRDGQRPLVYLVGLVVEGLKGAGVEHPHQVIECAVIVWDDGKHGLLAVSHQAQFHIVPAGNAHDLGENKGGQADGSAHQNGAGSLARGLLENFILPNCDMIRLFLLQRLKQQIQRGLIIVIFLLGSAVLNLSLIHI